MIYAQISALHGYSTLVPSCDFETYSEAGFRWIETPGCYKWNKRRVSKKNPIQLPPVPKWIEPTVELNSLPGLGADNRGLPAVGVRNYVQHPSFEILSLAYDLLDGRGRQHWVPNAETFRIGESLVIGNNQPWPLLDHVAAGRVLGGWNILGFEWEVWNLYCVPKWNWPVLRMEQCQDTMDKAAVAGYPRALKNIGKVLNRNVALGHPPRVVEKDPIGETLIRKLTVPRNPTKANPALRWTPQTAAEDFQALYRYNDTDVIAEMQANALIPDLSPREQRVSRMSARMNERGMQISTKAMDDCIAVTEQVFDKYNAELSTITNGAAKKGTEVARMLKWMRETHGVHFDKLDKNTVAAAVDDLGLPPAVRRVMQIRQTLAFSSVAKLFAMRAQVCADGRLRHQYAYAAAHTFLWNGQGVQMANLWKGKLDKPEKVEHALAVIASRSLEFVESVYGDALEIIADCLRSLVVAKPGCRLIASDYSAIQAAVTSALAGEKWRLDVFHTHGHIYLAMASQITGTPIEYYIEYHKKHDKHHDDRQLGKLAVLSADFGAWIAGWKRFGAEKLLGSDENIKRIILAVRAKQPAITEFWGGQTRGKFTDRERPELYGLEGAAISAVLDRGTCYGYRGVRFMCLGDALYCMPPGDGDPLIYHQPELRPAQRDYASPWELELSYYGWNSNAQKGPPGWVKMYLYGGVETQNVVAKVAREFQADALCELDETGVYLPVMQTHDEAVTEVEIGRGSKAEYLSIVNRGKSWAVDDWGRPWPIKAPGAEETLMHGKWE
jgi:DNA polymerase bacteriophage-type